MRKVHYLGTIFASRVACGRQAAGCASTDDAKFVSCMACRKAMI